MRETEHGGRKTGPPRREIRRDEGARRTHRREANSSGSTQRAGRRKGSTALQTNAGTRRQVRCLPREGRGAGAQMAARTRTGTDGREGTDKGYTQQRKFNVIQIKENKERAT